MYDKTIRQWQTSFIFSRFVSNLEIKLKAEIQSSWKEKCNQPAIKKRKFEIIGYVDQWIATVECTGLLNQYGRVKKQGKINSV